MSLQVSSDSCNSLISSLLDGMKGDDACQAPAAGLEYSMFLCCQREYENLVRHRVSSNSALSRQASDVAE